ncbi:ABC transporter ATP-binding protein [Leekyejoonella antrihumi]|uniref:ABC transporter ATP-binding protein n=1 Tax=Leekyejoonella antrihumi TaxID=1660198 RepID=UPI001FE93CB0|nr:ABC transporter ATP-binding protein [Leekyejoonella antrihumi]
MAKSYAGRAAVYPLDLDFRRGEAVALLGPNGAGKSTAIGMMLGLVTPDCGDVRVAGRSPREAIAGGYIAAMLQDSGMMPGVRVAELVRLGERLYPHPIPTNEALDLAGLSDERKRRVDRLSGGQAQRLRFALAIVANPEVLVLDEPTRALDVQGRAGFWDSMRTFAAAGRTVLFATHYLDEVDENAERVVVIARGRIVADGSPAEIRKRTGVSVVRVTVPDGHTGLDCIDGSVCVDVRGERVTIKTTDPDATVRAIVTGPRPWHDLEVGQQSLDDSFLALTQAPDTQDS